MIVVQVTYSLVDPTNEWVVKSWQDQAPGVVTTTSYPDVQAALREALRLFQLDSGLDTLLHERAEDAVLAANAATIATNKAALKAAEGL